MVAYLRADRLIGTNISFPRKSVTGTGNIIMAATLVAGETLIDNCACEPEISDLCIFSIKWSKYNRA